MEFHHFLIILFGLELGSFANVCIYRMPRRISLVNPVRSQCPWCQTMIAWYDNIPVFSYLFLQGKCRSCRSPISPRYPIVEALIPLLWIVVFAAYKPERVDIFSIGLFLFVFLLVIGSAIDLDWQIIPNRITYLLIIAGLVFSYWNPLARGETGIENLRFSLSGALAGGGVLWIIASLGEAIFKREVMGGGDVKLLAGVGTFIGWEGALQTLFVASMVAGLVSLLGIILGKLRRKSYIPFGPFLSLGAYLILLRELQMGFVKF